MTPAEPDSALKLRWLDISLVVELKNLCELLEHLQVLFPSLSIPNLT